ncbi:dethiobiotin synthase [Maricaulis sp.]|uniref:dethiobiotin synthase n=1 Tax=Maricaulis sp. TaxID=1486257 RepID=UPI00262D4928|nr:dethiobiotin synthase [Maricaulis sp.]
MSNRPIFFTATGTDIGKTHVLCALLEAQRARGQAAKVLKPVLSGFDAAALEGTDTVRLLLANGQDLSIETIDAITPWRFKPALSPDMAARRSGVSLRLEAIIDWCLDAIARDRPTIIEGAGGVMSPIAEDGLNLDLIRELDAHPVLVAGGYLGTISHTLTALRVLDGRASIILNPWGETPVPIEETRDALQRFAPRARIHVFDPADTSNLLEVIDGNNSD